MRWTCSPVAWCGGAFILRKGDDMRRTYLTDGSGKWFDEQSATRWREKQRWDEHNHVSICTGSRWDHQALFLTAGGRRWILKTWSDWQGSVESYETISERDALQWILVNDTPENAAAMNELIDEQVEAIDRLASATEL